MMMVLVPVSTFEILIVTREGKIVVAVASQGINSYPPYLHYYPHSLLPPLIQVVSNSYPRHIMMFMTHTTHYHTHIHYHTHTYTHIHYHTHTLPYTALRIIGNEVRGSIRLVIDHPGEPPLMHTCIPSLPSLIDTDPRYILPSCINHFLSSPDTYLSLIHTIVFQTHSQPLIRIHSFTPLIHTLSFTPPYPTSSHSGDETDDEGVSSQWLFDFPFGKKKEDTSRNNRKNRMQPRDSKTSRSSSGGTSSGSGGGGSSGGRSKDRTSSSSSSGRRRGYEDGYAGIPQGSNLNVFVF